MPPNILYLHSHDTGRCVQPYGAHVPTPHLQRFAEQGVVFRQAFSAAPTCSPSRAALLTGQCAHACGMIGLAHRGFSLRDPRSHLASVLRAAGYHTALIGVQHEATDPATLGYSTVVPLPERDAAHVAPAAARFLAGAPQEPFFLSVGFSETHRDYPPPEPPDDPRWCRAPAPLPDAPEIRYDMAAFRTSARRLDAGMGAVLEALDTAGLAANTLVVLTTDHGIAFPRIKCNLTDPGIGVMLMLRGPGGFSGGRVLDALVSQVDVFPTLCACSGVEPPAGVEGRSLVPLVGGEAATVRDAVFAEVTYHAAYEPLRCARTRRWKYIRRFGERSRPVLPNIDDSPSKTLFLQNGWGERLLPSEELYDLFVDPCEAHNLAADPAAAEPLAEMRTLLGDWMARTDDPLLRGPVPLPRGAAVNDPDGISPREPVITAD